MKKIILIIFSLFIVGVACSQTYIYKRNSRTGKPDVVLDYLSTISADTSNIKTTGDDNIWATWTFKNDQVFEKGISVEGTISGGASAGSLIKLTQAAGETYSGTTAGLTVKNYDVATSVHGSGENTGLAVFMKQLSASGAGGENSLASFHSHSSAIGKLDHGLVIYPDTVGSVIAVRSAVADYGLDFNDRANVVINTAEIRGSNGETIDNTTDGEWDFGAANIATTGTLAAKNTTLDGYLLFNDPGTNANSFVTQWQADNATTVQTASVQTIYAADPYFQLKVPSDAGTATTVADFYDQEIKWFNDLAGTDYVMTWRGETNDGTLTYMEDEDRFVFDNDLQVQTARVIDTITIGVAGSNKGVINFVSDAGDSTELVAESGGVILKGNWLVEEGYSRQRPENYSYTYGSTQDIIYNVHDTVHHTATSAWHDLFLDGLTKQMIIPASTTWTFSVQVSGTGSVTGTSFSYYILDGCITRDDAGNTTLRSGTPVINYETDGNFNIRVAADDTNEALVVEVTDSGNSGIYVNWMATVKITAVSQTGLP